MLLQQSLDEVAYWDPEFRTPTFLKAAHFLKVTESGSGTDS